MKKISAEIIADSINKQGNRITTYLLTYPRFIHSELMTHRVFSRNSASSRAIPFDKMVKMVEEEPFIPIAWQKTHKGMQGVEYFTNSHEIGFNSMMWEDAKNDAIIRAKNLNDSGVTKQLCNRLLEPFMWHTVIVTATEWKNFFDLRCPKYTVNYYPENRPEALEPSSCTCYSKKDVIKLDSYYEKYSQLDWLKESDSGAEIHIQALAEAMWDAMKESTPKRLEEGQWHIPFGDNFNHKEIDKFAWITNKKRNLSPIETEIAISTARCARLSYMTFDDVIDYEKDIKLHDMLLENEHMSPFEHCARAMNEHEFYNFRKGFPGKDGMGGYNQTGWCNNFRGFIQYRYLIENNL